MSSSELVPDTAPPSYCGGWKFTAFTYGITCGTTVCDVPLSLLSYSIRYNSAKTSSFAASVWRMAWFSFSRLYLASMSAVNYLLVLKPVFPIASLITISSSPSSFIFWNHSAFICSSTFLSFSNAKPWSEWPSGIDLYLSLSSLCYWMRSCRSP